VTRCRDKHNATKEREHKALFTVTTQARFANAPDESVAIVAQRRLVESAFCAASVAPTSLTQSFLGFV
jgi:hypothetical protein